MNLGGFAKRVFPYLVLGSCLMAADNPAVPSSPDWADKLLNLPITRWLMPSPGLPPVQPAIALGNCPVTPLEPITDREALQFESDETPNTAGLMPAMMQALEKFQRLIVSAGGSFELRSAFRPEAYQQHLQDVWYKWKELRYNHTPDCQPLRALVQAEFTNHHLMETQKPVTSSDHTRGMAFDATIVLPRTVSRKKRRVSVDRLALLAGIMRPDVARDPVHFKLVVPRGLHISSTE